jgi:hypothetical protein
MATYRLDPVAFREHVLNAEFMVEHMRASAEKAKAFAEAIAPFDPDSSDGTHYRDAFRVATRRDGGLHGDRAEATLWNDDPAAVYVEFGTERTEAHHVLTRALDAVGGV